MVIARDDDRKNLIQSSQLDYDCDDDDDNDDIFTCRISIEPKCITNCTIYVGDLPISTGFEVHAPTQGLSEFGTDSRNCQTMASSDCDVKLKREKGEIDNIISLSI